MRIASFLLLLVSLGSTTHAQTCTTEWTQPVDGNWSEATNWTAGVPDDDDTACITAAGTYTVFVTTNRSALELVLGGASGTQTLSILADFTATAGGRVAPNGRVEVQPGGGGNGYELRVPNGTFHVEGTLIATGGTGVLLTGGTLDVAPSGTVRLVTTGTSEPNAGATSALFRIRGLLQSECAERRCYVNAPLDVQGGTIRVLAGRLSLNTGGVVNGLTLDAAAGTELFFRQSHVNGVPTRWVLEGVIGGAPEGIVDWTGTEVAAGPAGVTLDVGGTGFRLLGSAMLTSAGGLFTNTGLLLRPPGTSNFSGFRAVVVRNVGTVQVPVGLQLVDGATLRNEPDGVIEITAGGNITGNGRLENAGLLLRNGNPGNFSFAPDMLRSLPGSEIRVETRRLDLRAPGSRTLAAGSILTGGGTVLIPLDLQIEGAVSPGTDAQPLDTLSVFGYFYPSPVAGSPRFVVDVAAGGQSDLLDVSTQTGTSERSRLGGALIVRVAPSYTPQIGDEFTILRSRGTIGGQFAQIALDGAPDGIAFVTEIVDLGTGSEAVMLRAVEAAPDGPITVSTTAPVGGAVRPIFLTGPGASGVAAARLDCTTCLDPNAWGSIPAEIIGEGTIKEARFDLTSPRAFGFYDLVIQRPSLPDEVVPVTVRPYLALGIVREAVLRGAGVRPTRYNSNDLGIINNTNVDEPAYPFFAIARPVPQVDWVISTGNLFAPGQVVLYESEVATDPTVAYVITRVPALAEVSLSFGQRIDPSDIIFPGQTPTGPDDPRLLFGAEFFTPYATTNHVSFGRATATVVEALGATSNAALIDYLADVDVADPNALEQAVRTVLAARSRYLGAPEGLLALVIDALAVTVTPPAGLAEAAGAAFYDALDLAGGALAGRIAGASSDAINAAPQAVRQLFLDELAVLGGRFSSARGEAFGNDAFAQERVQARAALRNDGRITGTTGNIPIPTGPFGGCLSSTRAANAATSVTANNQAAVNGESSGSSGGSSGGAADGGACASADPNDKTTGSPYLCEIGTVVVDGEEVPRCVRYYVPLADAVEPIPYTVTFENLPQATANAEFVTITDEIDPSLNLSTLEVYATSSDSTFSYSVEGRTVTFRFVGIDLPPNVTPPEGEGFVTFGIQPNAGLDEGAEIRNDASIVFDFNPPIETPEVIHELRRTSDLAVLVTAPDEAEAGMPVAFVATIANLLGDPAGEATLTITPPAAPVVSVTTPVGECTGEAPIICALGDLAQGEVVSVEVVVESEGTDELTLGAVATTTAFDGFEPNNGDAASVTIVAVGNEDESAFPREVTLSQPYPNPSRGEATLRWGLPEAGHVDVRVYDLLGREVARLASEETVKAGWHEMSWRASVASGVYIIRLKADTGRQTALQTRRLVIVR